MNPIRYLAEVKKFHRQNVAAFKDKPKGCSQDEILALEHSFGFELPLAYKQYLEWMGKDYRGIFVGCDWFISNVIDNTKLIPDSSGSIHGFFVSRHDGFSSLFEVES